jgi:hypothetical protein
MLAKCVLTALYTAYPARIDEQRKAHTPFVAIYTIGMNIHQPRCLICGILFLYTNSVCCAILLLLPLTIPRFLFSDRSVLLSRQNEPAGSVAEKSTTATLMVSIALLGAPMPLTYSRPSESVATHMVR